MQWQEPFMLLFLCCYAAHVQIENGTRELESNELENECDWLTFARARFLSFVMSQRQVFSRKQKSLRSAFSTFKEQRKERKQLGMVKVWICRSNLFFCEIKMCCC